MPDAHQVNLTDQDRLDYAEGFGQFLASLLVASKLSDEQKQAWATLVPEMSLEQMVRLATVLERYVDEKTLPEIVELRHKLQAAKAAHDAEIAKINSKAEADIKAVMDEVRAIESA